MSALLAAVVTVAAASGLTGCGAPKRWPSEAPYATARADTDPATGARSAEEWNSPGNGQVGGILSGGQVRRAEWENTIDAIRPATFQVFNTGCGFTATGSAVAIFADTLVTNRHVVAGARRLAVRNSNGPRVPVIKWTISNVDDLAVLHLADEVAHQTVSLADPPVPGDLVAALGYPLGGPLTAGQGRVIELTDPGQSGQQSIKASMDVLPGNSGGPLIGTKGELVGLIRAIDLNEGWALAVPADRIEQILDGDDTRTGHPCTDP